MARQPLPVKYHKGPWAIGRGEINKRPRIVSLIGQCAAEWSFVEHQQGVLLGFLMQANTAVAVAVFSSLRTSPVRRSALQAAAQEVLDGKELDLFGAILAAQKKIEGHRNDVVHGHWGVHDSIEDGAIWIASKDHTQWNAEIIVSEAKGERHSAPSHGELAKKFFVYKESDLSDISIEIMIIWRVLFDFLSMIREGDAGKRDKLYHRICGVRLIGEELFRIQQSRK